MLAEALRAANKAVAMDQKEEEPTKVINAYARCVQLLDTFKTQAMLDTECTAKLQSLVSTTPCSFILVIKGFVAA